MHDPRANRIWKEDRVTTLVFFRKDMFYPLDMPAIPDKTIEELARDNAECNPGTIRVEDASGNVLWRVQ